MDAPDSQAWVAAIPWAAGGGEELKCTVAPVAALHGDPPFSSKFGEVRSVAETDSQESMLWRLTELEAKSFWLEQLDQKFEAFVADVVASNTSLWKQVGVLEKTLGYPVSPPREVGRSASAISASKSNVRTGADETLPTPDALASASATMSQRVLASSVWKGRSRTADPSPQPYGLSSGAIQAVSEAIGDSLFAGQTSSKPVASTANSGTGKSRNISSNSNNRSDSSNNNGRSNSSGNKSESNPALRSLGRDDGQMELNENDTFHHEDVLDVDIDDDNAEVTPLEAHIHRTLAPSIWNAAFLIGMNRVGWAASVTISILLLINVLMQGTFLGIISKIVYNQLFDSDEVENLKNWRYFVGQSVTYYDPLTKTALAQRICAAADASSHLPVELSDSKAALVEAIKAYLPASDGFFDTIFSGPSLSMIALVFWTLKVFAEWLDILDTTLGMLWVPLGKRNIVIQLEGGTFRFASFTRIQKLHIGFVSVVRAVVCILLWVLGCTFLLNYSIELAELILNAVALEIVLNVDEVLFTLAPQGAKHLLANLDPLPGPEPPTSKYFKGLDARSFFLTLFLMVCANFFYFSSIQPLMERVSDANSTLCDGLTNVIFASDPYQFVYTASLDEDEGGLEAVSTATQVALEQLIYPETIPFNNVSGREGRFAYSFLQLLGDPPSYLRQVSMMTNSEAAVGVQEVQMGAGCANIMTHQLFFFMQLYMSEYGFDQVANCSDLVGKCIEVPAVRVVCPRTCGCDSPIGLVLDIEGDSGCPLGCLQVGRWQSMVAALPCQDWTTQDLQSSDFWHSWVAQFQEQLTSIVAGLGVTNMLTLMCPETNGNCTQLFESGCAFVQSWPQGIERVLGDGYSASACSGRYFGSVFPALWRPLAPICPESCGCIEDPDQTTYTDEDHPVAMCPSTCSAGSVDSETSVVVSNESDINNSDDD